MIDINHPGADRIFEAAGFTDRIKGFCRVYITQNFDERKETFGEMKTECENLKLFSQQHLKENITDINEILGELILEIEELEKIDRVTDEGNCAVCNAKLKTFDSLVKEVGMITICEKCPSKIYDYTNKLDWLTGAAWI